MTQRTLRLSAPHRRMPDLGLLVKRDLQGHFAGLACADHLEPIAISLSEGHEGLTCVLSACCDPMSRQVELHLGCIGEIAAMYGVSLALDEQPASAG